MSLNRSCFVIATLVLISTTGLGQKLVQGIKPIQTDLAGYSDAYCSQLSAGYVLCKAVRNENEHSEYVIIKAGKIVKTIDAPPWQTVTTSPDGFFGFRGDLDRDSANEIVLVSLESVSNGMGVTRSTAHIFQDPNLNPNAQPVSFTIEEFGLNQNFVYDRKRGRTLILLSYWKSYDSIDLRRIRGLYLVGKWFEYSKGKLVPAEGRPTMARRFLNSFASERDNGWFENRRPYRWLTDPRARRFFKEPSERSKPIKKESVVIETYDPENESQFRLRTNDGRILTGTFQFSAPSENTDLTKRFITDVGIFESQYVFPSPYPLPDLRIFVERLDKRHAWIYTYRDEFGGEYSKLWLLEK